MEYSLRYFTSIYTNGPVIGVSTTCVWSVGLALSSYGCQEGALGGGQVLRNNFSQFPLLFLHMRTTHPLIDAHLTVTSFRRAFRPTGARLRDQIGAGVVILGEVVMDDPQWKRLVSFLSPSAVKVERHILRLSNWRALLSHDGVAGFCKQSIYIIIRVFRDYYCYRIMSYGIHSLLDFKVTFPRLNTCLLYMYWAAYSFNEKKQKT